ncbi:hypothetical protein A3D00_03265 [Candidatus Woesebacteria bacterium RIFCSPHIGHO2_02_FULL_38_9]|uniref:DUF5673 domain-containing protein n=1 Tax=Candidatus Woesebacteria bacterium RIFCSPHIGHO2_01_FULL_39_28 TaxID=1802496 RepID=A0A1F7YHS8_9BACT|nr:MAG: hypothetical protein A2627_05710 [Candidatus Woesebacteria bacterium RIFCSPHIGHO2_01_FULL_39_28]OGM31482.1 MAG: hypothetical protein A3D00_03265 [Candidatus Woesebacteria bacterium RIFCSPHIGHO2_02_FULL_38_9]OGM56670.1 MAG: hypothetical protein A3A50_04905 [Candidatus Woesebacteria bacterium RIFCSPLOWO2_01_FULL_38_20]
MPTKGTDIPDETSKEPEPVVIKNEPEKDLLGWSAPARPFKRRDREFYVTVIAISSVIGLILFLAEGWLPVVLIISLVFLFYVMSTVEPEVVQYKITTKGIYFGTHKNEWYGMLRFWFSKRYGSDLLIVETYAFPGRIEIVIKPELKEKIKKEISAYLVYEEASPSFLDKAANWASKKLPKS